MPGIVPNGGRKLQHGVVSLAVADGVSLIRAANPKRVRIQLFNATAEGTGSTVYVGNSTDVDGNDLAATNGWPLNETTVAAGEGWKLPANVLELHTKDDIYGLAAGADATVKFIEELED